MIPFRRFAPSVLVMGVVVAVAALAAVLVDVGSLFDETEEDAAPAEIDTGTAQIQTLGESYSADGTLVYAASIGAFARVGQQDETVVTELREEGSTIERGDVLWRLGFEPTVALYGDQPNHRALGRDDEGDDVRMLEENLVALGFDPDATVTVDETFTAATESMVERWQEAIGAEVTGEVAQGAVVYIPDARRVGPVSVTIGESVSDGMTMLTLTAETREVTLSVAAADRASVAVGDVLDVRLPDRSEVTAIVTELVVDDAGGANVTAHVDADVPTAADQIPVTVSWSVEIAVNVLTVPESALIRTDSTQYYVEVQDGSGASRLAAVTPGRSTDGWVEVSGEIADGDEVVAP